MEIVLCACARAGLLYKGIHYFNQMANVYNVKPQFAHYWCMANLYAGAGLIQEAEKLLKNFPGDGLLDLSMLLGGLLGSCRFRGELDLGERIALHLIDLEPLNVSRYTLLATIYGVGGRWEDVEKVKMMMKKRGIQTTPRYSLLELNQVVHEFKIGDSSSAGMVEVYAMFRELLVSRAQEFEQDYQSNIKLKDFKRSDKKKEEGESTVRQDHQNGRTGSVRGIIDLWIQGQLFQFREFVFQVLLILAESMVIVLGNIIAGMDNVFLER
ncbi:hypothetical protein GIB67_040821 [Kingdonia uniflora]|uniref:Pentatricopeptide repeat-containing protein n=1 Tax=Kingdonia uniflora TaxID=39325 RepID=A0A7J7P572_9MAGN|nr:hypothetical protein GIB67_040821 [Kingdonia uniflora]